MIVEQLQKALGADIVQCGQDSDPRFHVDWVSREPIIPLAVVLPRSTEQVSTALRLCHALKVPVVPQGGLTGLVGGARPRTDGVVINLSRLRGAPEIDRLARTATVLAGTTLQEVQEAALAAGFVFPVDFGARGTCQIGGTIATNAGGVHVMHYGMLRQQVLGLEVVLADGTVLDSMNALMKNNTGYDLKQLFIGSEGTLGVITKAVLRLTEPSSARCVALAQVPDLSAAYALLSAVGRALPGLAAFEAMWPSYYRYACKVTGTAPLPQGDNLTLLIEIQGNNQALDEQSLLQVFETMMEDGRVVDATLSHSEAQAEKLWAMRDANSELTHYYQRLVGFDVSLAPHAMEAFLSACEQALRTLLHGEHLMCFGHLGDGNVHLVVHLDHTSGIGEDQVKDCVMRLVGQHQGSVSAEHGIGLDKLPYLPISRNATELAVMRLLKNALDPHQILNPGKLIA